MNVFDVDSTSGKDRLVLVLGPEEIVDSLVWGMLSHNSIPGVAAVERAGVDGRTRLSYDVTGTVTLQAVLDRTLRREETLHLVSAVLEALTEAERYMIDPSWFVLDPEAVHVDPATLDVRLLCLPVDGKEMGDPVLLLKHLVLNLRHEHSESTAYLGELVALLNDPSSRDLTRLARSVRSLRLGSRIGMAPAGAVTEAVPQHGVAPAVPGLAAPVAHVPDVPEVPTLAPGEKPMSFLYLLQHYTKENKETYDRGRRARAQQPGGASPAVPGASGPQHPVAAPLPAAPAYDARAVGDPTASFGGTIHVADLEAVRSAVTAPPAAPAPAAAGCAAPKPHGSLLVRSTGERVWIEGALFRIGRRRARVDLAVRGETVSKLHATIHHESAEVWAIIDNGSTNGVEVDGQRLEVMVPHRLVPGQEIRIGDETLVFEIFSR